MSELGSDMSSARHVQYPRQGKGGMRTLMPSDAISSTLVVESRADVTRAPLLDSGRTPACYRPLMNVLALLHVTIPLQVYTLVATPACQHTFRIRLVITTQGCMHYMCLTHRRQAAKDACQFPCARATANLPSATSMLRMQK